MAHNWSPRRALTPSVRRGEWLMADRGRRIGYVQAGDAEGRRGYRCQTAENAPEDRVVLGYAATLEDAARRLWEWGRQHPSGWRPVADLLEYSPGSWVMPPRSGHKYPQGFIERQNDGGRERYEASSGGTAAAQRELIGYYQTLDGAARAVWEHPIKG